MSPEARASLSVRAYAPRPVRHHRVWPHGDWHIKPYSISFSGEPVDWAAFEPAVQLALAALPAPAVAPGRPGVAFLIAHHGRGWLYLVLGWWDRENELPLRVFVRGEDDASGWRPAQGSESVCVWDLEVLWFEREAYVATVMGGASDGVEAYLERRLGAAR